MKRLNSTSRQNIKYMGSFLIAAGVLSPMFHMVLFPVIGVIVGIPLMGIDLISTAGSKQSPSEVCVYGDGWLQYCN